MVKKFGGLISKIVLVEKTLADWVNIYTEGNQGEAEWLVDKTLAN